jgi:hypothetical protein
MGGVGSTYEELENELKIFIGKFEVNSLLG